MSHFVINANFLTSEKCEEFCNAFQALLSSLGLECKDYSADHDNHYKFITEPMKAVAIEPEPQPEVTNIPHVPDEPVTIAVELPPMQDPEVAEIPPVTVDPMAQALVPTIPLTSEPTPDNPYPDNTVEPAPDAVVDYEMGPCRILTLNTMHQIPATKTAQGTTKLMVGAGGVNGEGKLSFWFAGSQFFMPSADEGMKMSVMNPDHEVKPNTIRVLAQFGDAETQPLLVDVEQSEDTQTERLILGSDFN